MRTWTFLLSGRRWQALTSMQDSINSKVKRESTSLGGVNVRFVCGDMTA